MSAQHRKTEDSELFTHCSSSSMHLPIEKQVQAASLPRGESVFVTVKKSWNVLAEASLKLCVERKQWKV